MNNEGTSQTAMICKLAKRLQLLCGIIIIAFILTFISKINTTSESFKAQKVFILQNVSFYKQLKLHAQLSWAWKTFLTSRPVLCFCCLHRLQGFILTRKRELVALIVFLSGSFSRCCGWDFSVWLWYFLIILFYFLILLLVFFFQIQLLEPR